MSICCAWRWNSIKLVAAALLTCGLTGSVALAADRRPLSSGEKGAIERAVGEGLRDPFSARFRLPSAATIGAGRVTCGYVNAKNAFGAYVGWRLFYGQQIVRADRIVGFDIIRLHEADDPVGSVTATLDLCRAFGNTI